MNFDDDEQKIDYLQQDIETGLFRQKIPLNLGSKEENKKNLKKIMKKVQEMEINEDKDKQKDKYKKIIIRFFIGIIILLLGFYLYDLITTLIKICSMDF